MCYNHRPAIVLLEAADAGRKQMLMPRGPPDRQHAAARNAWHVGRAPGRLREKIKVKSVGGLRPPSFDTHELKRFSSAAPGGSDRRAGRQGQQGMDIGHCAVPG